MHTHDFPRIHGQKVARKYAFRTTKVCGFALVAMFCLLGAPFPAAALQANPALHAERLAWQWQSWDSVEVRVRQRFVPPADSTDKPLVYDTIIDHYIETASGQRFLGSLCERSGRPVSRYAEFFDGKRGASLAYDRQDTEKQQQVIIHKHFGRENQLSRTDRPSPLLYYWVDRTPLHEALGNARFLGKQRVIGRDCDAFLFSRKGRSGQQDQIYCLDEETSLPLKVELYRAAQDRIAGQPFLVWTAKRLDKVQGYSTVREAVQQVYTGPNGKLSMTHEYTVDSIVFNKKFSTSNFWPELQPGVVVFDTITNKPVYPTPGAADTSAKARPTTTAMPVDSIRAEPPRPWTASVAPVFIALGTVILFVSLYLWRRWG